MNGNAELLNFIYQNSEMGVNSIRQLLGTVEDKGLKEHLKTQFQGYEEFHEQSRRMLNENGYDEKGLGTLEKVRTYLAINMETMMDPSASHIAEMLIKGSNMGVVDAIKKQNDYQDAEHDILNLMEKLQKFEERNIEKLKEFL